MSKRAKRGLVKVGHGGTLDPLARGIVVVGMGAGCKKLHNMSGASKTYIAEGRLGFSSTTLDSTGSLVSEAPTDHVTKESLLTVLESLKGEITQTPPLYSALSMDGKRLYEYAREGLALPRDIPSRKVQIYELELLSFSNDGMISGSVLESYGFCNKNNGEIDDGSSRVEYSTSFMPKQLKDNLGDPNHIPISSVLPGLVFHIRVHCSSGTYIRTLIADIAKRLDTVGLMSDLLRVDQSGFKLGGEATLEMIDCENIDKVDQAIQAGNRIYQSNGVKYE
ncbi:hypothetical protein BGZ76_007624 [Entomortierella beljakovae]|nr:hypothetical protein BGZ76_007624 [Entomortierella beljakovae]